MILVEKLLQVKGELPLNRDYLHIEWYESGKRILRRLTEKGCDLAVRLPNSTIGLEHNAILWQEDDQVILVNVLPCEAIVLEPKTMIEMGIICYEIGNRHLPLFYQNQNLLIPYETPLFQLLEKLGYEPCKETHRLTNLFRTKSVKSEIKPPKMQIIQDLLIDANTEIIR